MNTQTKKAHRLYRAAKRSGGNNGRSFREFVRYDVQTANLTGPKLHEIRGAS